jgi:DNA-binding transcriptional LysR family regulator
MKLHQLRYFAVLAKELHFGRAAERLGITQPPLSAAIKALEEELDVRLLLRDSKHVRLTSAGAAFLAEIEQILDRIARASETARAVEEGVRGRIDVAISSGSLFYRELPRIFERYRAVAPGVDLSLREMAGAEQSNAILQGLVHAGFANASHVMPRLECLRLADDAFAICLPAAHPLADAPALTMAQLVDEAFVMFARDVAPANYDNVIAVFNRSGLHPRTIHATRTWQTIVAMVANGMGIALVPSTLARAGTEGVRFVPLDDPYALSPALLAWDPTNKSAALKEFVACSRAVISA